METYCQPPADGLNENEDARLRAILHTQREIARAGLDTDRVLDLMVTRARELTGADGAVIEMREADEMVYRAVSGSAEPHLGMRIPVAGSLSGLCATTGTVLMCEDTEADPRVGLALARRIGIRSMILVPLVAEGSPVGILKVLWAQPRALAATDAEVLELMAEFLSAALDTAIQHQAREALSVQASRLAAIVDAELGHVRQTFGRFSRQVSGYALEQLLPEQGRRL
ncbi:MAG: GAF domain-containing protein, partial [Candidatus Sericytochromatia bacterium]